MANEKSTADRLELAAGDLVHRLRVTARSVALPADVLEALEALDGALKAHTSALEPYGDTRLIELQGRRIRALEEESKRAAARLAEACARVADLADEKRRLEEALDAARGHGSTPADVAEKLKAAAAADLAAHKRCPKCEAPLAKHGPDGACPVVS